MAGESAAAVAPSGDSGVDGVTKATRPTKPRSNRATPRPKKKVRPAAGAVPPPTEPAAPSPATALPAADATDGNNARARGLATRPGSMDEYRSNCQRLEKERHEKVYQSEKRKLTNLQKVADDLAEEDRKADAAFAEGLRALQTRLLMINAMQTKRIEDAMWREAAPENADPAGARRHEMSLRTRGDAENAVDEAPVVGRRPRKTDARAAGTKAQVKIHVALAPSDIAADLARISGTKRGRDGGRDEATTERRPKKRK